MKSIHESVVKRLSSEVNKEIDEYIVERLIYLFNEGILSLSYEKPDVKIHCYPDYALANDSNVTFNQKVWLKFNGEEEFFRQKQELEYLRVKVAELEEYKWKYEELSK